MIPLFDRWEAIDISDRLRSIRDCRKFSRKRKRERERATLEFRPLSCEEREKQVYTLDTLHLYYGGFSVLILLRVLRLKAYQFKLISISEVYIAINCLCFNDLHLKTICIK